MNNRLPSWTVSLAVIDDKLCVYFKSILNADKHLWYARNNNGRQILMCLGMCFVGIIMCFLFEITHVKLASNEQNIISCIIFIVETFKNVACTNWPWQADIIVFGDVFCRYTPVLFVEKPHVKLVSNEQWAKHHIVYNIHC